MRLLGFYRLVNARGPCPLKTYLAGFSTVFWIFIEFLFSSFSFSS